MYIRAVNVANRRTGGARTHHQLVECHRTEKGPRQRMIMHLGPLDLPQNRWRELASALEVQLTGQQVLFPPEADIQALTEEILTARGVEAPLRNAQVVRKSKAKADLVAVDLNSLATSESRSVGPELVGHTFYQRLGFPDMLAECGLTPYQRDLAEAVVLGRLVAPDSDLGTWRWLRARSSLSEFLATNLENVGKDAVYEITASGSIASSWRPACGNRSRRYSPAATRWSSTTSRTPTSRAAASKTRWPSEGTPSR